jgi:hypothetical protein
MIRAFRPGKNRWKLLVIRLAYFLFGRAAQILSRIDPEIRGEIARWPDDLIILYTVLPHGPRMVLARTQAGQLEYRSGKAAEGRADLTIALKNVESAYQVFSFQMGMNQAFAQNRLSVRGDIPTAMSQMRVLNRILTYMLPRRLVKEITLKVPDIRPLRRHVTRGVIYFVGIPFGV